MVCLLWLLVTGLDEIFLNVSFMLHNQCLENYALSVFDATGYIWILNRKKSAHDPSMKSFETCHHKMRVKLENKISRFVQIQNYKKACFKMVCNILTYSMFSLPKPKRKPKIVFVIYWFLACLLNNISSHTHW